MTLILFLLLLILPLYPLYSVNSQYIKFLNPQESWRPDCGVLASFHPKRVQVFCLQHTELPPPSVSLTLELSLCIAHAEKKLTANHGTRNSLWAPISSKPYPVPLDAGSSWSVSLFFLLSPPNNCLVFLASSKEDTNKNNSNNNKLTTNHQD